MKYPRAVNAKIVKTTLGVEDHGVMSFWLHIEWPGAGCSFGGYCLDGPAGERFSVARQGHGHSYQAIREILETVGVGRWEQLPGTLIRIEENGPGGTLTKIAHIMDDRWFDVDAYMKAGKDLP